MLNHVNTPSTILLLDEDERSAQDIQRFLKVSAYAFTVNHASNIGEALNYLKNRKPDLLLVDSHAASQKEYPSVQQLTEREKIPVVLLADTSSSEAQKIASRSGATDYLIKNKVNLFHLQKIITNALKITQAEHKLDDTYSEFVAQHEAFYKVLNKMQEGVLVINQQNAIRYANTKAYAMLAEEPMRSHVGDYIRYRECENENESVVLSLSPETYVQVHISELVWNNEPCNLFVFNRQEKPIQNSLLGNSAFQAILNLLQSNIYLLKGEKIQFANKAALQLMGLKQLDVTGKAIHDFFETQDPLLHAFTVQMFLADKQTIATLQLPGGARKQIHLSIKPVNIQDEFLNLMIAQETQPNTEPRLAGHKSEEDLMTSEDVLHLASHDLREPVRTILNYVQLVAEKLDESKFNEAIEYNRYAHGAAERMEKLLTDLKTYIGLNNYAFSLGKVSAKLSAADAIKNLKHKTENSDIEINVTDLPDVSADRELLERLFYHLIDNAIKFRKKDRACIIDIGFDRYEGRTIYCVRDNGIGIARKYHDKIFNLFERLNRVDEYPGNGLGLAIAKKIVEMHGGSIWVESAPGSGSGFYFTLQPK